MLWSHLSRSDCLSLELAGLGSDGPDDAAHGANGSAQVVL